MRYSLLVAAMLFGWPQPVSTQQVEPRLVVFTPWLLESIKNFEKLSLVSYQDTKRYRSIGYGHRVGPKGPHKCTRMQAERWLRQDIKWFHKVVSGAVLVPLTQSQQDALISFTFNIGPNGFKRSTVLQYVNNRQFDKAALAMTKYVKADGRVSRGLVLRRQKEVERFLLTK